MGCGGMGKGVCGGGGQSILSISSSSIRTDGEGD